MPDTLVVTPLPALADNYIWLLQRGAYAVVVDPGEAAPVRAALAARGLKLAAILVTHHHADHQGGVAELAGEWAGNRSPGRGATGGAAVYAPLVESITGVTHPLAGGETLALAALLSEMRVLAVPGHTRGHLAYLIDGYLFCGDTLFGAGCGRLFEGSPQEMQASLARIAALPDETRICCAHEYTAQNLRFAAAVEPCNPAIAERVAATAALRAAGQASLPSTLALEKASNPFLRWSEPEVIAAARAHGAAADDPVAVFAALRAWRNDFR